MESHSGWWGRFPRTAQASCLAAWLRMGFEMSVESEIQPRHDVAGLVHRILRQKSIDRTVTPGEDLREAGLTSLDMVELVLAVEAEFGVSVPSAAITPANFRSVAAIDALIASLRA
jgi:acyl carrier protein